MELQCIHWQTHGRERQTDKQTDRQTDVQAYERAYSHVFSSIPTTSRPVEIYASNHRDPFLQGYLSRFLSKNNR